MSLGRSCAPELVDRELTRRCDRERGGSFARLSARLSLVHIGGLRRLVGRRGREAVYCICPGFTLLAPTFTSRTIFDSSTEPTSAMSQTASTSKASTSKASSRFQAIFDSALKSYQKQTKKDLIAHPLASQLQSCNSTNAIIAVLQDLVHQFDQAHSGDERLIKWLNPTVNVLFAFSAAISGGVSLVSLGM